MRAQLWSGIVVVAVFAGCHGAGDAGPEVASGWAPEVVAVGDISGEAGEVGEAGEKGPGPQARVIFVTQTGEVPVEVEVAATNDARRAGLMFRKSLAPGKGMIFLMDTERVQAFWMHNTLIALDMIFVDHDKRVVGIVAQAEPQTDVRRSVEEPSLYVIEVPGGWAARAGIATGDVVRFDHVEP